MSRTSVSHFIEDRKASEIDLGGGAMLAVVYRPGKMAGFRSKKFRQLLEAGDPLAASHILKDVLVSWELDGPIVGERPVTGEGGAPVKDASGAEPYEEFDVVLAGAPVPIEPDVMQFIPDALLLRLWAGLNRDMLADPTTRATNAAS